MVRTTSGDVLLSEEMICHITGEKRDSLRFFCQHDQFRVDVSEGALRGGGKASKRYLDRRCIIEYVRRKKLSNPSVT